MPAGIWRPAGLPNPRVFLDVAVGGRDVGRITFELFADELPITAENFRCLCTGETGLGYWLKPRWYKYTKFHRIIPGFMCQGGDFNSHNGYMGESIYGQFFRDERFLYRHDRRGILSMAKGNFRNTNNSQFFVTFGACPWLDGKHVAFGHVQSGLEVLDEIEKAGTERGKPLRPVEIFACGEVLSESFFKLRDSGVAAQRRERNTDARVEEQRREATRIAAAAEEDVHVQSAALKEEEDGNEIGRHQSAPARGADDGKSASWERGESSEPAEDESPPTPPRPVPSAERTKERPALLPSPSEPNFVPVEVYRRHKYF